MHGNILLKTKELSITFSQKNTQAVGLTGIEVLDENWQCLGIDEFEILDTNNISFDKLRNYKHNCYDFDASNNIEKLKKEFLSNGVDDMFVTKPSGCLKIVFKQVRRVSAIKIYNYNARLFENYPSPLEFIKISSYNYQQIYCKMKALLRS